VGLRVATGPRRFYLTALLCLCKNPCVCGPLRAYTAAYPPVVIETAVEFGVAGEASVSKSRTAHTALQAALMVRDVDDSHDVAIADRTAADATQRHRHFTASTIFGHRQGPTENKNSLIQLPADAFHELSRFTVNEVNVSDSTEEMKNNRAIFSKRSRSDSAWFQSVFILLPIIMTQIFLLFPRFLGAKIVAVRGGSYLLTYSMVQSP